MNQRMRSLQWVVLGALGLTIVAILLAFLLQPARTSSAKKRSLPSSALSEEHRGKLPILFEVTDFALTNQAGRLVTRSQLQGQVWLADIIFTRCSGPCPEMTRRMSEIVSAIPDHQPIAFITLTTDPEHDTPAVLQTYRRRFSTSSKQWHFLTGSKKQLFDLAVDGLKLTTLDKDSAERDGPDDLFVHSTLFVLIDQRGRARAVFESDVADLKPKALRAINQLFEEK